MAKIRTIEIANFRSIQYLKWRPSPGVNCLIGPGDSGKSTILDAIEFCLSPRRNLSVGDTDFFNLDVGQAISVTLTLGDLPDALLNLETMADFLRGFDQATGEVEDEPRRDYETVLTLRLTVQADLDPIWRLYSDRNQSDEIARSLGYKVRSSLATARLGQYAGFNLSWSRGSLLNRLSDERVEVGAELAAAARQARLAFGEGANQQLAGTLQTVTETARRLGVDLGGDAKALLDAHSVSFDGGTIALHNEAGIPLRSLGTGSARLLVGGLQRAAAQAASILLVDEVEHGLEPHRLTRLLLELGAKLVDAPIQVFLTTHSPVALRELSCAQLHIVRPSNGSHDVRWANLADVQGTIRTDPQAFLAKRVIVCEGASEVGLIRGLDRYRMNSGEMSLLALAVAYVDSGGGDPDRAFNRARALQQLGYEALVIVDQDQIPTPALVREFEQAGGTVVQWRAGRCLEHELFLCLPAGGVTQLLNRAKELVGSAEAAEHIKSKSNGKLTLEQVVAEGAAGEYSQATRECLGAAATTKNSSWFKTVSRMEDVAHDIVSPHLDSSEPGFKTLVETVFEWAKSGA
ncbi:MAG: AAA family ATPase [Burkholderiales bacterium]